MLEMYRKELENRGMFQNNGFELLDKIVDSVPNEDIPHRMKLLLAITELTLVASHLRRNIKHWNGSEIPINTISFSIAASGFGKDSSVNAIRKCFKPAYDILETKRKEIAKQKAIERATLDEQEEAEEWHVYKDYYIPPAPLFVASGTPEGFVQHLNDLDADGTGAGYLYDGEFSTTLQSSKDFTEIIKLLAEIYDEGNKDVKVIKNRDFQSKAIKSLPVSALFVSSADNILYDETIKRKFKVEFSSKLARRSLFNFSPHKMPKKHFKDAVEALKYDLALESKSLSAREEVKEYVTDVIEYHIDKAGKELGVSNEVRELFTLYKKYNEEYSEAKIDHKYPISKISRSHIQWKALKLSGAIAIFNGHSEIKAIDYIYATSVCELLAIDLMNFEQELNKEEYELFADFVHMNLTDDSTFYISLHDLRKLGYIPKTGSPTYKMNELIQLVSSYDTKGIYTLCDDGNGICYERVVTKDTISVSIREFTDEELENY